MNAEVLKDLHEKSMRFLCQAYLVVREDRTNSLIFATVLDVAGISHDDFDRVEEYLSTRNHIKRRTVGRLNGSFDITHLGFCQVEEMIMDGEITFHAIPAEEEASSQEIREVDIRSQIIEERKKRSLFLYKVYEAAQGNRLFGVTIRPIAEEIGLTEKEAYNIEVFLEGEYLLKRRTMGGWNGSLALTDYGVRHVEDAILEAEQAQNEQPKVVKRGPNADTKPKLTELKKIRREHTRGDTVNITWTVACQRAGIRPETVIEHEPELRKNWYDVSYGLNS